MKAIHILFTIILFSSHAVFANSAVDDFNQKKYDSAFRAFLPAADSGQPAAMFYLGRIYFEGLGSAPKDTSKGISYITRSAEKNFEPAIKFLAQNSERNGNLKQALNYYERLKSNGDVSNIEKIAELNEKLFSKDRELTKDYCNSLEASKIINKAYNETRYATCAIEGKLNGKDLNDGIGFLRSLSEKGNDSATLQLIPYLLSSRSNKLWDPAYVDSFIFKNINNPKIVEQAKLALNQSDLNFELCRFTPPGSNFQTQNYRASICRLSALKGDQKAIYFVSEKHLYGTDLFVQDTIKANFFIDILENASNKIELKLYALQLSGRANDHFEFLSKNTNINPIKLNQALVYQIQKLNSETSPSSAGLQPPSSLTLKASLINEYGDCKSKLEFHKFLDTYYIKNIKKVALEEEDKALIVKFMPSTDCQKNSETSASSTGSDNTQSNSKPINAPLVEPSTNITSSAQPKALSSNPSITNIASSNFSSLISGCDSNNIDACLEASDQVIKKKALVEITDDSGRKKVAFDLLDKAIKLGSIEAKYRSYDYLNQSFILLPEELVRSSKLIDEFKALGTDSANIRIIHDSVTSSNPISGIFNALGGKFKELCAQAIYYSNKTGLSAVERKYIEDMKKAPNCNNNR
jgi:TPR repeat protein